MVGSNPQMLFLNHQDGEVYIRQKDKNDILLSDFINANISAEVDSLCKLVLQMQSPLVDVLETLVK